MRTFLLLAVSLLIYAPTSMAGETSSLKSVDSIELEAEVSDFLGFDIRISTDHDDRCRRYGDCRGDYDRDRDRDRRDRDRDRCRRYGDCDRRRPLPPPDRRPGRPGYPDDRYGQYFCYAENARRQTFRGVDTSARWAQQEAMDQCYRVSYSCRALGCRYR
jgi:hypothetical protein